VSGLEESTNGDVVSMLYHIMTECIK